jgi:putative transposase
VWLQGSTPHHKPVRWLLQRVALEAVDHKPRLTRPMEEAQAINPYLLRGFTIEWMSQVRSTDITSIRLHAGRVYLVVVKAWFS